MTPEQATQLIGKAVDDGSILAAHQAVEGVRELNAEIARLKDLIREAPAARGSARDLKSYLVARLEP